MRKDKVRQAMRIRRRLVVAVIMVVCTVWGALLDAWTLVGVVHFCFGHCVNVAAAFSAVSQHTAGR